MRKVNNIANVMTSIRRIKIEEGNAIGEVTGYNNAQAGKVL
jgi:hypothetical protein